MTLSSSAMPHNLRIIGGEMLVWTDRQPDRGRVPVGGAALEELLRPLARPGGRALVAGPHEHELVTRLESTSMRIICLVRSYPDAAELAARHPQIQVLCGSVTKMEPTDSYDLVIACDGLGRLVSVEGATLSWADTAQLLVGLTRPGGTLVLAQENLLGVHRLVRMSPWYGERTDADWIPLGDYDETRPASLAELDASLAELGLTTAAQLVGFPTTYEPSVLLSAQLAQEPQLIGFLQVAVSAACGAQFAGQPVLSDPRTIAAGALRSGAGAALAPCWFAIASRQAEPEPGSHPGHPGPPGRPEAGEARLIISDPRSVHWPVRYEVVHSQHGWIRRLLSDPAPISRDSLRRDPLALVGPLPGADGSQLLEERLIALCLRRDLPELARLLVRHAGWLADAADADGLVTGAILYATPGDLLVAGDTFTPWDPTWSTTSRAPVEVALARALRRFAIKLITGGYSHPWPALVDADSLTVILGGLAGHTLERPTLTAAVTLEAQLRGAELGLDTHGQQLLREQLSAVTSGTPPLDLDSHRELHAANIRLREELAHEKSRTRWAEGMLASREKSLNRALDTLDLLSGSVSYRVGKLLILPLRKVKALLKRLLGQ